jgi:hypothetical protein
MPSPLPGMDPYLEAPTLWPDVHGRLAVAICDQIQPSLSPRYTAVIVPYVAYESIDIAPARFAVPDVAVLDRGGPVRDQEIATVIAAPPLTGLVAMEVPTQYHRIEIRTAGDETVVTVIEILSPANKRPGADAADAYERKRREILRSDVHLLEIDLLRGGRRPSFETPLPNAPYFIFLSRAEQRPRVGIWPLSLQQPILAIPVPLRAPDPDVALDLTRALQQIYASARYDLRIDYQRDPPPPELSSVDGAWLDQQLRVAGVR